METILGIKGPDFVMLGADRTQANSIILMKSDQNKIYQISDKLMMAAIGDQGDTIQFTEFISKNLALYKMRNGYELTPREGAHFTRRNLAEYLRSRTPYQVNMLIAGFDEKEGPELHYIDYLANAKSLNYSGQGYGGLFCASVFDRYHHANITEDEAYEVMKKCVIEIQKRLIINLPNFRISIVDKNGVRDLDDITSLSLRQ